MRRRVIKTTQPALRDSIRGWLSAIVTYFSCCSMPISPGRKCKDAGGNARTRKDRVGRDAGTRMCNEGRIVLGCVA